MIWLELQEELTLHNMSYSISFYQKRQHNSIEQIPQISGIAHTSYPSLLRYNGGIIDFVWGNK